MYGVDQSCPRRSVSKQQSSQKRFPFGIFVNAGYERNIGQHVRANDGWFLLGGDFSFRNLFFKKICTVEFFAGAARDRLHFREIDFDKGTMKHGFFGYHMHFDFAGWSFKSRTAVSFGTSNADSELQLNGITLPHFKHHHRLLHSRYELSYSFRNIKKVKYGPVIGIVFDRAKQNPDSCWSQETLRLESICGLFGGRCEYKIEKKFRLQAFIGLEHSFRHRWKGGAIEFQGQPIPFEVTPVMKNKLFLSLGVHYHLTDSIALNANLFGRYGGHEKTTAIGISLNKIF